MLRNIRLAVPPWAWLVLTGIVFIASFLKTPQFPTNDPALFEYYGRHLLHGQRLYVDLWDNKLPSIYVINEHWQWLFGSDYRWHVAIETLMNATSVGLFSLLLRRNNLTAWPWATFCFAAILVLPPAGYDYTEFFALPLILGSLLAVDLPILSGACIALAATFWLPSLLMGVALCWSRRRMSRIALFFAGALCVGIPYALAAVMLLGGGPMAALVASWPVYIVHGSAAFAVSRLAFLRAYYDPVIISGAGAAFATFLVFVRRPQNDAQRLAIASICATVFAAIIPGNESFHHFIPALGALVFGVAAFARRPFEGRFAAPRMLAACAAILLLAGTAKSVVSQARAVSELSQNAQTIGACIQRTFGANATIYVQEFAPELYLAADAAPGNRFGMVDPVLHMTQRRNVPIRPPQVFIGLAEDQAPQSFQLRYIANPWHVYTAPSATFTCP